MMFVTEVETHKEIDFKMAEDQVGVSVHSEHRQARHQSVRIREYFPDQSQVHSSL